MILTQAVATLPFPMAERELPVTRLAGPVNEPVSGSNVISRTDTFSGLGWRPLSPVHLKTTPVSGGLQLSWVRRTRTGGDGWASNDVPLGEVSERYEIDIFDGAVLKRTLTSITPSTFYPNTDIIADFGATTPGTGFSFTVAQVSDVAGRGREGRFSK